MKPNSFPKSLGRGALVAGLTLSSLFCNVSSATADVPAPQEIRQEHSSFAKLAKELKPAVVNIVVEKTVAREASIADLFGERFDERGGKRPRFEAKEKGQGSGVILSSDGYILTNNHVVSDARNVKVTTQDGRDLTAKVIGTDPQTDLALVKIEATNLPFAALGNSDKLEVGDWVMAIGSPFGLDATVTVGVLSAKGRVIGEGPYDDFLQTDASINPGNSGGPLFNVEGQVVGINTAVISNSQGIGFSIPINMAKEVVAELKGKGHVTRGYLGVHAQSLTPKLRRALRLPENTQGALVAQVQPNGPAGSAGLQVEDVVTAINGRAVHSDRELSAQAAHLPVGQVAQITVIHNGQPLTLAVNIVEHPRDKMQQPKPQALHQSRKEAVSGESLGIDIAPLTRELGAELKTENLRGVVIADVETDSAAQRAGLKPGDIIRKVNDQPITSLDQFVQIVQKEKQDTGMAFLVERQGSTSFMVIDT